MIMLASPGSIQQPDAELTVVEQKACRIVLVILMGVSPQMARKTASLPE